MNEKERLGSLILEAILNAECVLSIDESLHYGAPCVVLRLDGAGHDPGVKLRNLMHEFRLASADASKIAEAKELTERIAALVKERDGLIDGMPVEAQRVAGRKIHGYG